MATEGRPYKLVRQLRKDVICFFKCFFRADVIPDSRYFPNIERRASVHPLHQSTWLIWIVTFLNVLVNHRQRRNRIIVESYTRQSALWLRRLFFEEGDAAGVINFNGIVLLNFFKIADVINTKYRR